MRTWPPRFLFHTGFLSLDFAHTGGEGKWAVFERLQEPRDLADWLAECALRLHVGRVAEADVVAARGLRGIVWDGAQGILRQGALPPSVVAALNAAAAAPDLAPVLVSGRAAWRSPATASQALSMIARDAIALFGGPLAVRIRECRNPRCPLLFVDTSRPGRRVWCAMRRCGNLEKTARYRRSRPRTRARSANQPRTRDEGGGP